MYCRGKASVPNLRAAVGQLSGEAVEMPSLQGKLELVRWQSVPRSAMLEGLGRGEES